MKNSEEDESELKSKVKELEEELENCKETIESYEKTIDELSKELQGTFRKKKKTIGEDGIEDNLQRLLGQINLYLDSSELSSSKEFGETLKNLQSKIELLKSGRISL